jgi:hypothetical protein
LAPNSFLLMFHQLPSHSGTWDCSLLHLRGAISPLPSPLNPPLTRGWHFGGFLIHQRGFMDHFLSTKGFFILNENFLQMWSIKSDASPISQFFQPGRIAAHFFHLISKSVMKLGDQSGRESQGLPFRFWGLPSNFTLIEKKRLDF